MDQDFSNNKNTRLDVESRKVDSSGSQKAKTDYDTSKNGLNVHKFTPSGGSLVWNTGAGTLGWMLPRTMLQGSDGLNHQGCIAVILDDSSLAVIKNLGQTSGHSFANHMTADGSNFLAVDLGDNYPRGVHVHKLSTTSKSSKVSRNKGL